MKKKKKLQKLYPTNYNLLVAQDLWSLSNLVNNLPEGIQKIKCKYGHNNKGCKTCRIKYKNCDRVLINRIQMFVL